MAKRKANNRSANAESMDFKNFLYDLIGMNIKISSVTTDNSMSLIFFFANEFPDIVHYIDLWHILMNMNRKFQLKFSQVCFNLF